MENETIMKGDKLVLRGLKFHGYHGVLPEERKLGQKFVIDVDAYMDLRAAGKSDNVFDTVSSTDIYNIAREVVEGPARNLQKNSGRTDCVDYSDKSPNDIRRSSIHSKASHHQH